MHWSAQYVCQAVGIARFVFFPTIYIYEFLMISSNYFLICKRP